MRRSKFTLVELLVVMALLSIMSALIVPALRKVHNKTLSIKCLHNLKGIGSATAYYLEDNNDYYMYGFTCTPNQIDPTNSNIIPFGTAPHELLLRYTNYKLFVCPSDPAPANFNWWRFPFNPIFNAEGNSASYTYSAQLLWYYPKTFETQLHSSKVLAPNRWGITADGAHVANNMLWTNSVLGPRLPWTHDNGVNMLFGDGNASFVPTQNLIDCISDPTKK